MKIKFLNFKNLSEKKGILKNVPWFLGRYAFIVILASAFLSIILGWFLFYNYVIIVKKREPEINKNSLRFREDLYQRVLERLQIDE